MNSVAPSIFLVGITGVGKTSVGRALARRLDRPFFDLDEEIARAARSPVATIFATKGEGAFRRLESRVLHRLASNEDAVIATGGGAMMCRQSRELLKRSGFVVQLRASIETLMAHIGAQPLRPILGAGEDLHELLRRLALERADGYAAVADLTIDCDGRTVEGLVTELAASVPRVAGCRGNGAARDERPVRPKEADR